MFTVNAANAKEVNLRLSLVAASVAFFAPAQQVEGRV
jgi:hypothetical protein